MIRTTMARTTTIITNTNKSKPSQGKIILYPNLISTTRYSLFSI